MPFDQLMRHTCVGMDCVNDTLYTTGNNGTGIVDTVSHGIAGPDLDGDLILLHQFHQFQAERNHITVDIRSGDILQMTSGADPLLQAVTDNA